MQSFDPLNHFFSLSSPPSFPLFARRKRKMWEGNSSEVIVVPPPTLYAPSSPIVVGNSSTSPRVQDSIV